MSKKKPSIKEKMSIEEYLKDTPPEKIHENFLAHIHGTLERAKLKKEVYFNGIAQQLAAKQTVYLPEKKIVYKMECREGIWGFVKYKLEEEKA